jgi:hypothetical protein
MRTRWRQLTFAVALSVGASTAATIPAAAQQDQNHHYERDGAQAQRTDPDTYANHPEYSNNQYYRTGNDEGYQDYHAKKRRDRHNHQYRNDDDRKAHDYGYDEGWSGRRYEDNQNSRGNQTYGNNNQNRTRENGQYQNQNGQSSNQNRRYRNQENQKHDKTDDHDMR